MGAVRFLGCEDPGFPLEPAEPVRVHREGREDYIAVELGGSLADLVQAPLTDEGGHVVVPDARARTRRHGLLEPRIGSFYA